MNRDLDYSELLRVYHSKFLPAYSSLISYLGAKPSQIRSEQENILGHIMQTGNPDLSAEEQETNLDRALCHTARGTLDCYKLIWVSIKKRLDTILGEQEFRRFILKGISEDDFIKEHELFRQRAEEAREYEMANIGKDTLGSIDKYFEATQIAVNLLSNIDEDKLETLKKIHRKYKWREWIIAGFIGALIGYILTLIL